MWLARRRGLVTDSSDHAACVKQMEQTLEPPAHPRTTSFSAGQGGGEGAASQRQMRKYLEECRKNEKITLVGLFCVFFFSLKTILVSFQMMGEKRTIFL